jgi:hypothetical protein
MKCAPNCALTRERQVNVHGNPVMALRSLRYFVAVAKVLLVHTGWHDYQHAAPSRGAL